MQSIDSFLPPFFYDPTFWYKLWGCICVGMFMLMFGQLQKIERKE